MEEITVNDYKNININNIEFEPIKKYKPIGFITNIIYENEPLILEYATTKTHNLITIEDMKLFEFDITNNNTNNINELDHLFVETAFSNKEKWFNSNIPKEVIEEFYTPMNTNNSVKCIILNEDKNNIVDYKNNTIDYDSINIGDKINIVLHFVGLRFYKQKYFCIVNVKRIEKVCQYQLVDYDSNEEYEDEEENMNMLSNLDIENSEIVDLELAEDLDINDSNIKELDDKKQEKQQFIDKLLEEKLKIMEEVTTELNLLKNNINDKEIELQTLNNDVEKVKEIDIEKLDINTFTL